MSSEIKNTLFRFVTMRAPELSDEKNIQNRFLYRSEKIKCGKRIFDTAIITRAVNVTKWNAMKSVSATFADEALQNVEACRAINPELYDFAIWLARNRYSYSDEELISHINNISSEIKPAKDLTPGQIEILWDNTFYQVVTNKKFYVKETVIQLLLANNLINSSC